MQPRRRLEANLRSESKAYGYTLTIWGSGALLITNGGLPTEMEVFGFAVGAVFGFALLALVAFGGIFEDVEYASPPSIVVSMIHVVATIGALGTSDAIVQSGTVRLVTFFAVGAAATTVYNLLLLVEVWLARRLA
ncbi:MAG: hypothetical protein ABEJ82_07270 [Haloplanus sp.]